MNTVDRVDDDRDGEKYSHFLYLMACVLYGYATMRAAIGYVSRGRRLGDVGVDPREMGAACALYVIAAYFVMTVSYAAALRLPESASALSPAHALARLPVHLMLLFASGVRATRFAVGSYLAADAISVGLCFAARLEMATGAASSDDDSICSQYALAALALSLLASYTAISFVRETRANSIAGFDGSDDVDYDDATGVATTFVGMAQAISALNVAFSQDCLRAHDSSRTEVSATPPTTSLF
ncbi:hypothetical protein CYMTET_27332 [Cymbomonas tetramitiformis]|uniref:Uncharacterized protein n=1 Tax=Cymbomonas tetramitiformis TaxID=36881 RepID=A0AAE0EUD9_9CHLO|nr:hypothetical protein CYMTET_49759 [Cymbomonas tetramitiformis]KAK3263903.1 hypothetical protein CYMTET_27332 [Cymbomonas tetramitiformis]